MSQVTAYYGNGTSFPFKSKEEAECLAKMYGTVGGYLSFISEIPFYWNERLKGWRSDFVKFFTSESGNKYIREGFIVECNFLLMVCTIKTQNGDCFEVKSENLIDFDPFKQLSSINNNHLDWWYGKSIDDRYRLCEKYFQQTKQHFSLTNDEIKFIFHKE